MVGTTRTRVSPTTASACARQLRGAFGVLICCFVVARLGDVGCCFWRVRVGSQRFCVHRDPIPPLLRHCETRKFKPELDNGDLQPHGEFVPDVRCLLAARSFSAEPKQTNRTRVLFFKIAPLQMLPPLSYPHLPAQCIMTRYCHTSINKRKCPVRCCCALFWRTRKQKKNAYSIAA